MCQDTIFVNSRNINWARCKVILLMCAKLLQLQEAEDVENIRPTLADVDRRPASAECVPCRRKLETDAECDGPRVTVTERPAKPFTDFVRLQRPAVTRQNWERVRAKSAAAAAAAAKSTSSDATAITDRGLPVCG